MSSLLAAFFTQLVIVSYRDFSGGLEVPGRAPIGLPLPADYTAPIIVYGALALFPDSAKPVAGMIGWGLVVATLLNLWNPSGQVNKSAAGLAVGGSGPATYKPAPPGTVNQNAGTGPATPGHVVFAPRSSF